MKICLRTLVIVIICAQLLTTGCSSKKKINASKDAGRISKIMNKNGDVMKNSNGLLSLGYLDTNIESLIYSGSEISVPYYIENLDKKNKTDIGLMIYTDGQLQPYIVEEKGGRSKKKDMHIFHLKSGERKEFRILFWPVTGKAGDKIGFIPVSIFNPEFHPDSNDSTLFGNTYKITENVTIPIEMRKDGIGHQKRSGIECRYVDIPDKIKAQYEGTQMEGEYDAIDSTQTLYIESDKEKVKLDNEGGTDLVIDAYGGPQDNSKLTLFVNNKPVKLNGGNYIQYKTKKNRMVQIRVRLESGTVSAGDVIYAMRVPCGDDYKADGPAVSGPVMVVR